MKSRLNVRHVFWDFLESSKVNYLEGSLPTELIANPGHYIHACNTPVRKCLVLWYCFLWSLLRNIKTDQVFSLQRSKKKQRSNVEIVQECNLARFPAQINQSTFFFHMGFDLGSPIISLARETSYSSKKTFIIHLLSPLCVSDIYNTWRET